MSNFFISPTILDAFKEHSLMLCRNIKQLSDIVLCEAVQSQQRISSLEAKEDLVQKLLSHLISHDSGHCFRPLSHELLDAQKHFHSPASILRIQLQQ